jgi:hypothetical protein
MRFTLLSFFLAGLALASPVTVKRDSDGLEWMSQDASLPKVMCVDRQGAS